MAEVVGLYTTCDVWLTLENTYIHHLKAHKIHLKDNLQLMKHDIRPIAAYAHAFKALCDQLPTVGWLVDDNDKVH